MKQTIKLICLTLAILLVCVTLFNLACFVKGKITGEQCPLILGFGSAVVMTGSMEDTISPYDLVVVHRAGSYEVDDIVVYQGNTYCVTHRIVAMEEDAAGQIWVTTQGDANNAPDDPIKYERIIGRVIMTVPGVGAIRQFLRTPTGFLLLTLLTVAALFAPEWVTRRREEQNTDGKDEK